MALQRINEIIDAVRGYHPGADVGAIQKAYVFSAKVHKGQVRRSGEPYLSHPLAVAALLAEMHTDVASICAALLHDAVEDTNTTVEDVAALLGPEVASLVDGVTKITQISATTKTAQQAENMRKMILAMANDIRVLLIKLGRPSAQHAHPGLYAPGQAALHRPGNPRHLRPHGPPSGHPPLAGRVGGLDPLFPGTQHLPTHQGWRGHPPG